MLDITITEDDYASVLGPTTAKRLKSGVVEDTLGPEATDAVIDALPKVIAARFRRMLPEGYEVKEICLTVSLSGSPFGVGLSGDASVKFGPTANPADRPAPGREANR
jgi:hypothetical protein